MLPVMFSAGILAAGLWALVPCLLKAQLGINEIITGLMMNYVAMNVVDWDMEKPFNRRFQCINTVSAVLLLFTLCCGQAAEPKLKVGFIYVGPISDFGWTRSHDEGRRMVEKNLPWVETSYVESVSEGELES
jgi:hypothetical protein